MKTQAVLMPNSLWFKAIDIKMNMKHFLDPYRVAVQKKLIIESKNKVDKKHYTLADFGGAYGNNHEICSYLVQLYK